MENRKKILVIDDEPDVRMLLRTRLSANNFEILEAADGSLGVALAKEKKPDLILLDIVMPGKDGIETYHALEQDPSTKPIPVIFLSALGQNIASNRVNKEVVSYAIVGKPYKSEDLIQEIQRALGEGRPL